MDKPANSNAPDEVKIEEMLGQLKPVPTSRFHSMINTAPWQSPKLIHGVSSFKNRIVLNKLVWGVIGLLILFMVLGTMFIPSIRVIARQIMYSFIPAPSNQIEVKVTANPEDLYHFSDPENFPLSVDEAQIQAGFPIKQLSHYPEGMIFVGVRFDTYYYAVILLYQGNEDSLFLTQRPLSKGQDVFSIGESAMVKNVMIGGNRGELVTGGWKAISTKSTAEQKNPDNPVIITAVWDNDLPQSTLRWQTIGFAYEIRCLGEDRPSEEELIKLANELK
jgi:hypothetical protein